MSKVVLHIGTHKTATTTIQDMFWINSDLLSQHGLIYPSFERATGHHGLVLDWPHRPQVYELPNGSLGTLNALVEQYADTDQTLFLSSEEFSRDRSMRKMDQLRDVLSRFDQIEVIMALRPQWQFLQSIYLEVSKKRLPPRPPQLVAPVIESGMYEGLWVDYTKLLDALEPVFGPEEITLIDFDSCRHAEGGIVGHLLRHLSVDLKPEQLKKVNDGASNVSPMPLASWAANILAQPKIAPAWLIDKTTLGLRREYGDDVNSCLFTKAEFAMLKSHFEALNQTLAHHPVAQRNGFALSAFDPSDITLFRENVSVAFWVRMAGLGFADRLKG